MPHSYAPERIFYFDAVRTEPMGRLDRPLTNPCELFRSAETVSLLRLCGIEEERLLASASDYAFLCALCEAFPLLAGHRLAAQISFLTSATLGISPGATEPEELWRRGVERLERMGTTPAALLTELVGEVPRRIEQIGPLPVEGATLPTSDAILMAAEASSPADWAQWEKAALAALSRLGAGGRAVCMTLPADLCYRRSNRYAADRYVRGEAREGEAADRWIGQQLRFFSDWACRNERALLLVADGAGREILPLLEETERAVGLPRIAWIAEDDATRDALLCFASRPHAHPMERVLPLERYPTAGELDRALESYAARTPLGRLLAVTDGAWWGMPYERARLLAALARFAGE